MKRIIVLFSSVLALLSCGHREVVWDQPVMSCSTESSISILKVVINDEKTAVHMQVDYPPRSWFRFAKETYIDVGGKHYAITGADSINLGEFCYTNPTTGLKDLILYFEPIPKRTRMFDLLEGTAQGDFTFFNIRQKGVKLPKAKIPADFLPHNSDDEVWPEFAYSEEPVTIHIKALNYKPGMNPSIRFFHFDITDPTTREGGENIILNDDGTADFSTRIYVPQHVSVNYDARHASARFISRATPFLVPGAEITLLMDMNITADSVANAFVGCKGFMADFNNRYLRNSPLSYPNIPVWSIDHAKTVDDIISAHDSMMLAYDDYYDRRKTSDFDRIHLFLYELRFFGVVAEHSDSLFRTEEFLDYILRIRPACIFDDSYVKACRDYLLISPLLAKTDERGKGPDLCRFLYGVSRMRNGKNLNKPLIEDPGLSNLYDRLLEGIKNEIEKKRESIIAPNIHYLDLADVAPENIQQTIVDRYKGKTVVFDIWETGCGWCLVGFREMTPLKKTLKDKNIVFVYLATYSSPFDQWLSYATSIPGEHYYLTEEQIQYMSDRVFGSNGVPKYAIFDTQGKMLYKQLGWGGLEMIQTEIEKALK